MKQSHLSPESEARELPKSLPGRLGAPFSPSSSPRPATGSAHPRPGSPHLGVLVGGHGDELGFLESKDVCVGSVAGRLWLSIADLDDVQPGLVLMEGLEHDHLREGRTAVRVGGGSSKEPSPSPTYGQPHGQARKDPEVIVPIPLPCHHITSPRLPTPVPGLFRALILFSCPFTYPQMSTVTKVLAQTGLFRDKGTFNRIAQLKETLHPFPGTTGTNSIPNMVHE